MDDLTKVLTRYGFTPSYSRSRFRQFKKDRIIEIYLGNNTAFVYFKRYLDRSARFSTADELELAIIYLTLCEKGS